MDAQEFITKKYENNNWGFYPPSRRLVGEWLEEFSQEYHAEQLRLGSVSPRIDWVELRNNFFNECTIESPREESGKKVNMAPHDLFEWFKREICEYVG